MKIERCTNGHFYDTDKYSACPHCAKKGMGDVVTEALNPAAAGTAGGAAARNAAAQQLTEPVYQSAAGQNSPAGGAGYQGSAGQNSPVQQAGNAVYQNAPAGRQADAPKVNQNIFEIKEENHTVGYYSRVIGTEPVVGWLVCTEGEYFGESFKLKSGRNFIGRSSGMDVVLSADMSVSRSKHAIIVYEPRKRMFIAQPGESRELFYLNDDVVLSNVEIHAYDVLTIGTTKLMLIPCCSEKFSWDDVIKKEN